MKQHIIIEKAYTYPDPGLLQNIEDCTYDMSKGYWILNHSNEPMVYSEEGRNLGTKKCDRETGEDQKGE